MLLCHFIPRHVKDAVLILLLTPSLHPYNKDTVCKQPQATTHTVHSNSRWILGRLLAQSSPG